MRPWRESPLLRMIRRADLVRTLTFFASVVFLAAGFLVGTKVKVLGTPICFNDIGPVVLESASCASSPHLAGELTTFGLLTVGGLAAMVGVMRQFTRPPNRD
jgi:hypothetical protein